MGREECPLNSFDMAEEPERADLEYAQGFAIAHRFFPCRVGEAQTLYDRQVKSY